MENYPLFDIDDKEMEKVIKRSNARMNLEKFDILSIMNECDFLKDILHVEYDYNNYSYIVKFVKYKKLEENLKFVNSSETRFRKKKNALRDIYKQMYIQDCFYDIDKKIKHKQEKKERQQQIGKNKEIIRKIDFQLDIIQNCINTIQKYKQFLK